MNKTALVIVGVLISSLLCGFGFPDSNKKVIAKVLTNEVVNKALHRWCPNMDIVAVKDLEILLKKKESVLDENTYSFFAIMDAKVRINDASMYTGFRAGKGGQTLDAKATLSVKISEKDGQYVIKKINVGEPDFIGDPKTAGELRELRKNISSQGLKGF